MRKTFLCLAWMASTSALSTAQIFDVAWPRAADVLGADPEVRQVIDALAEHDRQVEQREAEWLAKQKR